MIKLTKKDVKFVWNAECKASFQQLKHKFILAPILMHFDAEKEIIVETDASDYGRSMMITVFCIQWPIFRKSIRLQNAIMKYITKN